MMVQVFAVRDSKAELYSQPWFSQTLASGVRAFEQVVNDGKSDFGRYPNDFCLFHICQYDDANGVMVPNASGGSVSIGLAAQFVKADPQLTLMGGRSA